MILYTDGGRNKEGAYGSWALFLDEGTCIAFMSRESYTKVKTNNGAEYMAMLRGLTYCAKRIDEDERFGHITLRSDSKLVIKQVQGTWNINFVHLRVLRQQMVDLMENFDSIILEHVPRAIIVEKLGH